MPIVQGHESNRISATELDSGDAKELAVVD